MRTSVDRKMTSDLESTPDSVNRVTAMLTTFFDRLDSPEEVIFDIKLAVQEAVVNSAEHGNKYGPQKKIQISCEATDDAVTVVVCDEGDGFDPNAVPDPTLPENILKESGRGLFLMRNLCDEIRYNNKGNEVTIVKKLPKAE